MQISSDIASQQLSAIVNGPSSAPSPEPAEFKAPAPKEATSASNPHHEAFQAARAQGQEAAFLQGEVDSTNDLAQSLQVPLNFSVEVSDRGDYFIRILDEAGKEVKVIPSEKFVETRERIHAEIKGLIEDSQS